MSTIPSIMNNIPTELQELQARLQKDRLRIQFLESQLRQTQSELEAVKTSKFWKIREKWFECRKILGIKDDNKSLLEAISIKFKKRLISQKTIYMENKKWDCKIPFVSVVIPCYNYGKYVEEAIDSVLNQTFQNLEIIIVDDGSTDHDTIELLRKLSKPKTRIIRTSNQGPSAARNNGIREAKGKYICCLDADDMLKPTYIEKCIILMEEGNLDVAYSWMKEFGNSNLIWQTTEFELENLIRANCCIVSAVFKRSIWNNIGGYDETMQGYEDWDFWVNVAKNGGRGGLINEPLFLHRRHGKSRNDDDKEIHDILCDRIQKKHPEAYKNSYLIQQLHRKSIKYTVTNAYDNIVSSHRINSREYSKNNVLFLLSYFAVGGGEKVALDVIRACNSSNYNVSVITTLKSDREQGNTLDVFGNESKELYQLPQLFDDKSKWKNFIFYMLESRSIDIIFLSNSTYGYELLPEIKKSFPHIKVVAPIYWIGDINNNQKFSKYVDLTILESDYLKYAMDWLPISKQKLIKNGIDIQKFKPDIQNNISNFEVDSHNFVISFIGRFSQEKGPDLFIKILSQLQHYNNLSFIMAGDGESYPEIVKLIKQLKLEDRVSLPGFINSKDYLSLTDLLILPSESEGRPNIVLESLAMGVPVVASSVGGVPELIQDGYNGYLCQSGNVNDFVERIEQIINNRKLHLEMSKNAREYAVQNLDIKIIYQQYVDVFESLIDRQKDN
jgi:O-antigen biosynthesis protein